MAPGPDEVDVHHLVAAHIAGEEVRADIAIQRQQGDAHGENRKGGNDQYVGAQGGPGEHRHLHQLHAGCPHAQYRNHEVDPREQRSYSGYL